MSDKEHLQKQLLYTESKILELENRVNAYHIKRQFLIQELLKIEDNEGIIK